MSWKFYFLFIAEKDAAKAKNIFLHKPLAEANGNKTLEKIK